MMEVRNILLMSCDVCIIEAIQNAFAQHNVYVFDDSYSYDFLQFDVIVFDDCNTKKYMKRYGNKIINISRTTISNALNIARPFRLVFLLKTIENFLLRTNETMRFSSFEIVGNTLVFKKEEVKLGSKELSLISFLYKHTKATKAMLLKDIWSFDVDMETNVLDTTLSTIKKKFREAGIDNFILTCDGWYTINPDYYRS